MNNPSTSQCLTELFALFTDYRVEVPACEEVSAADMPTDYRTLLAHADHMTLALESFHGRAVKLHVLAVQHHNTTYARMILLSLEGTDKIVEFGIVRMNLSVCSESIREAILSRGTPLGRILVEHDVLRQIEPRHFLKMRPNAPLMEWFRTDSPEPIFGRLATILYEGVPAIELLEVVRV